MKNAQEKVRHPDLFTAEEAMDYLYLDTRQALLRIKKRYGLQSCGICKADIFHRSQLDRVAELMAGCEEKGDMPEPPAIKKHANRHTKLTVN